MMQARLTPAIAKHAQKIMIALCVLWGWLAPAAVGLAQSVAPVLVVETAKGTFEIETYPEEAPKTVAHIVELVRRGFYDGQRVHRVLPRSLVQWGDPRTRDADASGEWGRGTGASSGQAVGAAEITKKRLPIAGAVAIAHPGIPARADSQIFVLLANRPDLNGKYAVFGRVVTGEDVPGRLERGDLVRRMSLKASP